jgi:hypothetical protein
VLLAVALAASACSDEVEPVIPPSASEVSETPAYDPLLDPAAAVLPLVPTEATALTVTDFDRIRLDLGETQLSSEDPARVRDAFWGRVADESPALTPGLLRSVDDELAADYGFTQDDVAWEARFATPDGLGYVLKFHDDVDMAPVLEAIEDGVGPLRGAEGNASTRLAALDITLDPAASWAAEPELTGLIGSAANATYVERSCIPVDEAFGAGIEGQLAEAPAADLAALEELGPYSLSFGSQLVTARLGPARSDAFERVRLAETLPRTDPEFGLGFVMGVADPSGGRIGYEMGDPAIAAGLALQRRLPFAVCAAP